MRITADRDAIFKRKPRVLPLLYFRLEGSFARLIISGRSRRNGGGSGSIVNFPRWNRARRDQRIIFLAPADSIIGAQTFRPATCVCVLRAHLCAYSWRWVFCTVHTERALCAAVHFIICIYGHVLYIRACEKIGDRIEVYGTLRLHRAPGRRPLSHRAEKRTA